MNKKFMVVALMAALSTVGYAYDTLKVGQDKVDIARVNKNFKNVESDVNGIKDRVQIAEGNIKDLYTNKADQKVVEGVANDVNGIKDRVQIAEGNIKDLYANKADKTDLANKVDKTEFDEFKQTTSDLVSSEINGLAGHVYEEDQKLQAQINQNKENQEKVDAEQDKVIANKADKNYVDAENKKQDEVIKDHGDRLGALESNYAQYDGRLSGLEKKVDHLDDKMNKGLSLMAAMNAVDFQNVQTGEMALGAGIGHYGNAQSVALGVAYAPVEDLTVNAKYSITAGDPDSFAVGAGATYKFKVGR